MIPAGELATLRGTIYVAAGHEGAFRIAAIAPGKPAATRTVTPPGGSFLPAPTPRPLALMVSDQGELHLEQMVLLGATADDAQVIGPRTSMVRSPTMSADGALIVFEADSHSFRDLYRLDVTTGAVARLTENREGNFEPSLAPDGTRVAFTSSRDGDAEIYVTDVPAAPGVRAGTATRLTTFHRDDWSPMWSPTGAWIAFVSDREGAPRLFVIAPDGTNVRPLHADRPAGEEQAPTWSPDGSRVAYVVSTRDGAAEVWVAAVATGQSHRVSAAGARDEVPSWSPDGLHLVYVSTRDRRIDLWVARADGTAESRLTDTPEEEWIPRWLP